MTERPAAPLSRREQQQQTRKALLLAARAVFARDGYQGANLGGIAKTAGFSKGAVYSNFSNKADLFLAVMDMNIEDSLVQGAWDPFECQPPDPEEDPELAAAIRGFALATLEFIAVAARDEDLSEKLAERLETLTGLYTDMAENHRAADDPLTAQQIGTLLAALDQGTGLLTLTHRDVVPQGVLHAGMHRLLDPMSAHSPSPSADSNPHEALHHNELRRRLFQSISDDPPSGD